MFEGKCFTDIVKKLHERGDALCYGSLLNVDLFAEYWKEIDSSEPLIKDEKIRKAIKAWAEVNSIEEVIYAERAGRNSFTLINMSRDDYRIEFVSYVQTLEDAETYSIAELCGEEDE